MTANEFPVAFVRTFAFLFGALWGSFANVVIYRWPREMSVVRPGSHCFACQKPVAPYDNLPILSYVVLRGRCRHCGARFSPRYAIVELLFAVMATALAERVFFTPGDISVAHALAHWVVRFAFVFALLVTAFIDVDEMLVPWFTKWFAVAPLVAAILLPELEPAVGWRMSLLGAAIGYLGLRVVFIDGYRLLTGRPGMGLGDAEVLLLVGALLGPAGVLFALGAGAVQGVIATGIVALAGGRLGPGHASVVEDADGGEVDSGTGTDGDAEAGPTKFRAGTKVPFVPFLALAALEYLLGADALVNEYLSWVSADG